MNARKALANKRTTIIQQERSQSSDVAADIFAAQRTLRKTLLDRNSVRYRPARDLAAHMLLHLDDLSTCWSIATSWLQAELGCHRVDTGFGDCLAAEYFPGFAEAKAVDHDIPSFAGKPVDNQDAMMQAMWRVSRPLVYADIKHDARVSVRMRQRMSGAKTRSKMAWALRSPQGNYGLICADWTEHLVPSRSDLYDCFEQTVADVFSPIVFVAKGIFSQDQVIKRPGVQGIADVGGQPEGKVATPLQRLTPSERDVAKLVAKGLSYKEIARIRGRSFSTIDHQLRSIREKTGSVSTAALVHFLTRSDLG